MITNKPNVFTFYLFCISILTIPINISFINGIRLSDIFFITSFLLLIFVNQRVDYKILFIFSAFFGILLISTYTTLLFSSHINIARFAFFYKYSLIFLIPFVVINLTTNKSRLKKLLLRLYFVFIILTGWVYLYFILRYSGVIQGNPRVSFPFSNYNKPDAHVYSSYLVFFVIAYHEYIRKVLQHGTIRSSIVSILSVIALFMTGSKTGVLIFIIYIIIMIFFFMFRFKRSHLKIVVSSIFIAIIMYNFYIFGFSQYLSDEMQHDTSTLFKRATQYQASDISISVRYNNFFVAMDEIEKYYFLIGKGPIGASSIWYDGGMSIILAHGGLLGISSLLLYIFLILIKTKKITFSVETKRLYKTFVLLLFIYILLNLITEHFLLTRNLLPAATMLSIIYANIKINLLEYSATKYKYNL